MALTDYVLIMEKFEEFKELYDITIANIVELRELAEAIKERMDDVIDACETIEGEL